MPDLPRLPERFEVFYASDGFEERPFLALHALRRNDKTLISALRIQGDHSDIPGWVYLKKDGKAVLRDGWITLDYTRFVGSFPYSLGSGRTAPAQILPELLDNIRVSLGAPPLSGPLGPRYTHFLKPRPRRFTPPIRAWLERWGWPTPARGTIYQSPMWDPYRERRRLLAISAEEILTRYDYPAAAYVHVTEGTPDGTIPLELEGTDSSVKWAAIPGTISTINFCQNWFDVCSNCRAAARAAWEARSGLKSAIYQRSGVRENGGRIICLDCSPDSWTQHFASDPQTLWPHPIGKVTARSLQQVIDATLDFVGASNVS